MISPSRHESHPAVVARLKRAHGHLQTVISMVEDGRPCIEVAQQIRAVESAITNAKRVLIHDHMDHCLDADASEEDRAELRAISHYL